MSRAAVIDQLEAPYIEMVRLKGASLTIPTRELVSEPVCPGAVQVTPDGQCIVLALQHDGPFLVTASSKRWSVRTRYRMVSRRTGLRSKRAWPYPRCDAAGSQPKRCSSI